MEAACRHEQPPQLSNADIEDYMANPNSREYVKHHDDTCGSAILRRIFPSNEDLAMVIRSENQTEIAMYHRRMMKGYLKNIINLISTTGEVIIAYRNTAEELQAQRQYPLLERTGSSVVHGIRPSTDVIILISCDRVEIEAETIAFLDKFKVECDPETNLITEKYELRVERIKLADLSDKEKTVFWREFYEARTQTTRDLSYQM